MTDTNPTPAAIAAAVKRRAKAAGISDTQIAVALGITRQTVNRRLNGHQPLTTDDLVVIAALVGMSVEGLVAPTEDVAA